MSHSKYCDFVYRSGECDCRELAGQVARLARQSAADHKGFAESRRSIIEQRDNLRAALDEHDKVRAELMRQHEEARLAEWQAADRQIKALEAERLRVTELAAQWAQERDSERARFALVEAAVKTVALRFGREYNADSPAAMAQDITDHVLAEVNK